MGEQTIRSGAPVPSEDGPATPPADAVGGAGGRASRVSLAAAAAILGTAAIVAACENPAPPMSCGPIPRQTVVVGETAMVRACFDDPNGDVLVFTARSSDPGVAGATAAGATVTVTAVSPGAATVTISAQDPGGLAAVQTFAVVVPNRPPVATGEVADAELEVGRSLTLDVSEYFSEPDGQELAYAVSVSADVVAAGLTGAELMVEALARGAAAVTVTATDPGGLAATLSFAVTVPNRGPAAVGTVEARTIEVGEAATVDMSPYFSDPDGDDLVYAARTSDAGRVSSEVSGSLVEVTALAKGAATVTVTATDVEGASADQSFEVTVPNRPPAAVREIPAQTVEAGREVSLPMGPFFTDPDGDVLVYAVATSDAAVAVAEVDGAAVTVVALAKGGATVTVTATDVDGVSAASSFAVTVPNRPPAAVGEIPAQTVEAGERRIVELASYFTDPDGDALVHAVGASDTAVVAASVSGGSVVLVAAAKGEASVTVTATDPEGLAAVQAFAVAVPNRAPAAGEPIRSRTLEVEGAAVIELSAHFSDPDGDSLAFAAASSDTTVARVEVRGDELAVTALAKGASTVTVTASDGEGAAAAQAFTVTVSNRPPRAAVAFAAWTFDVGDSAALELGRYFIDPDDDDLAFAAAASDPAVAVVSVSGTTLAVRAVAGGEAEVTVTATDAEGLSADQTFTVAVTVPNRAPAAVGSIPRMRMHSGSVQRTDLAPFFSDPEADPLTFGASSSDGEVVKAWVSQGRLLLRALTAGTTTVEVAASDPGGLSAVQEFEVLVEPSGEETPNRAPVASGGLNDQALQLGDSAAVDVASWFSDPDGDALAFTARSSDTAVAGVSAGGSEVTLTALGLGTARIEVTAADPGGLTATIGFGATVSQAADTNRAPVAVGSVEAQRLNVEGDSVSLDAARYFRDPDGDALAYAAASTNTGVATVETADSRIMVRTAGAGSAAIVVTASDVHGLSASLRFPVTVGDLNEPPVVVGAVEAQQLDEGDSLSLDAAQYFRDPEGDTLTYAAESSNTGAVTVAVAESRITVRAGESSGSAEVVVTASDVKGLSASLRFAVTVGDATPSGFRRCTGGSADGFSCSGIDLMSRMTLAQLGGHGATNDVWGWTDPVTGTEWALVGTISGTSFVSLADPERPVYTGFLPRSGERNSVWRDIKVYSDHAYIVADGAGAHGMQVFDLTNLRGVTDPPKTFSATANYSGIGSAHNIVINEATGFAYSVGGATATCGPGLHVINISTPASPAYAGCFNDSSTGNSNDGYTHDAQCVTYGGPDTTYTGNEVCFGANENRLSIADVTDKANPVALASVGYPSASYAHQGWLDDDHEYFYMNDELDEIGGQVSSTRTVVWDVKDLDDPVVAAQYLHSTTASDHNLYIDGDLMYQANYTAGLRILSISSRESPGEVAYFDTEPGVSGAGTSGAWSSYPYFASGVIPVTSRLKGVFFVKRSN